MNLKDINLDKLEELPSKLPFHFGIRSSYIYERYRNIYNKFHEDYKLNSRKLEGLLSKSIGIHHDIIYSKFIKLYTLNFYMDPLNFFRGSIKKIISTSKGLRVLNDQVYTGQLKDLDTLECAKNFRRYYFDIEGFLRECPIKSHTHNFNANTHYKYITDQNCKRKLYKQQKKDFIELLKFINKVDLFEFFKKIAKEKIYLEDKIRKDQYDTINYSSSDKKFADFYYRRAVSSLKINKEKLKIIIEKYDKLLKGETNIFYESNEYLYSVKPNCHHFENP